MAGTEGMSSTKALKKFRVKLLKLPMKNEAFLAALVAEEFFAGDQHNRLLAVTTEMGRVSFFLDDVIDRAPDMYFGRLLRVMQEHDEESQGPMSKLALEIWTAMGKSKERAK